MNGTRRILMGAMALMVVVTMAIPSLPSDPATQDATVPTNAGEVV